MWAFGTLSPSVAEFAKATSLTQTIKSLLFDQLQNLWLDPLTQLTENQEETLLRPADPQAQLNSYEHLAWLVARADV